MDPNRVIFGPIRILGLFLFAAGILISSVILIYSIGLAAVEGNRTVARERGILQDLTDFISTLKDAETGQRGYLLTGDERYLDPYREALGRIETTKAALRQRASAGYLPLPAVEAVIKSSDARLSELAHTIQLRRDGDLAATRPALRAAEGKAIMDGIRAEVSRLAAEEERKLQQARQRADTAITTRTVAFVLTIALNLGFLAWAYRRIAREIRSCEAATRENERQKELLATTLASIGDGVIATDAEGRVTFLNAEAERLTGWKNAEAAGQPLRDVFRIVNEDTRQPVEDPVDKVLRVGAVVGLANHTILIARDGKETLIGDSAAPIRSGVGPLSGVVLVFRDFTEHKRAEEAVRANEQRLQVALIAGRMGTWEWHISTGRVAWSPSLEEIHGLEPGAFGGTFEDFKSDVHPDDRELFTREIQAVLQTRQNYHVTYRIKRPDGAVRWLEAFGSVLLGARGEPERLAGVCMDITERRRAEEALRESEARFAGVINSAMDAVIAVDAAQRIVLFNPAAEQMFGCRIDEAIGSSLDRFIPASVRDAHRRHVENFGKTGATNRRMGALGALSGLRANGEEFPIEASISHLEVGGKKLFTVILRDVTERKRADETLRQARDELVRVNSSLDKAVHERTARLEEMVRELQHVSYAIAHDMRAPLRAMGAFAEILIEEASAHGTTAVAQDYCRRIVTAAGRLDTLIRDALNYSRTVLQQPALEPVDLAKLLRGLLDTYPNFHADKADIVVDGRLPVVLGNESLLTQCFSNLLGNAVKFVAPGTRPNVRVRVGESTPGMTRVWIEDNGIGIPDHAQSRLFGMFQKLDHGYEGTGIGLAIVRKVVERMDGKVGVVSQPDKGSRFWVELRVAPAEHLN